MSIDALTLDDDPAQAIDKINSHDNAGGVGQPVTTTGIADKAVTTAKIADNAINTGQVADGAVTATKLSADLQSIINQSGSSAKLGLGDFIVSGLNIASISGLNATIKAGNARIGETNVSLVNNTALTLSARKAALLYIDKTGNLGKFEAIDPITLIDNNTVCLWKFNNTVAGGNIPNSAVGISTLAVANDLIPHGGIISVDGWNDNALQLDGITGYFLGSNLTNFPTGAAAQFEINVLLSLVSYTPNAYLFTYGQAGNATSISFGMDTNGNLIIVISGSGVNTQYVLLLGIVYLISLQYDGRILSLLINGTMVWSETINLNITNTAGLKLGISYDTTPDDFANVIYHYVEIRNKPHSAMQLGAIANNLLLPCFYDKPGGIAPTVPSAYANLYHEYLFNENTGSSVADSDAASALNGTVTGTTIVPSVIGLAYARHFNGGSDVINCGNFACGANFSFIGVLQNDILYAKSIWGCGASTTARNIFHVVNGDLRLYVNATGYSLLPGIIIPVGVPYFLAVVITGTTATTYYNDNSPVKVTIPILNSTTMPITIGGDCGTDYFSGTIDYIMFGNFALSQPEVTYYYKTLMLHGRMNIIKDVLPDSTLSLGFARTDSTKIVEYNDADYKYGKREKAIGGNRRVFLGWQYFSGGTNITWKNPFGTRKIKYTLMGALDVKGTLETGVVPIIQTTSAQYGVYTDFSGTTNRIVCSIQSSGAFIVNGSWVTVGYIGCYAECLEEYEGVDAQ
ncbi:hypothetical protein [Pectinatus frisingensis]|uniref:hypothetical protein n=1 Tax=Pectinatus frisingensis TaxID=865 RepID=UPI0018C4E59E|nr:hypothetical protein [Pectinatus frisingensis]